MRLRFIKWLILIQILGWSYGWIVLLSQENHLTYLHLETVSVYLLSDFKYEMKIFYLEVRFHSDAGFEVATTSLKKE